MRIVFEKREAVSRKAIFLVPVVSFFISLVLGGILLLIFGINPLNVYAAMAQGAFGSGYNLSEVLVKAIPLMLLGLGVSIAFRMQFWNIGAEGQLMFGAMAATWVALYGSAALPGWLVLPAALLAGIVAGALWAGIPAMLKAYLKVDETLTTLMLNYVAILFVQNLYYTAWRDPNGYGFPGTALFPATAWLPRLAGRAHIGVIFAIVAAAAIWFILKWTGWGFEIRIIGENPVAARYLGINIPRNIVLVLLISGALAGLAGASEVTGISHRLQAGISMGYGYTAIIVAWMAQLNPWAVLLVSLLMAALLVGGDQVQMMIGLPSAMALILQGMILFPMLAGVLFTEYRLRIVRPVKGAVKGTLKEARQ